MSLTDSTSNAAPLLSAGSAETNPADVANLLLKMKQQQEQIERMQKAMEEKDQKLTSAVAEKRKEMQAYMEGIKQYIQSLKEKIPEQEIQQVLRGLERCAEAGERNPLFEVMVCASALHKNTVTEAERIRSENEELKKHMKGGIFGDESARVSGVKRPSDEISPAENVGDFWDTFEQKMKEEVP